MTLVFALLLISCNTKERERRPGKLPYYNEATFTPLWLATGDEKVKSIHKIPSFNLINQDGEQVTENTFKDKIYVSDFFFTSCPGICPKMTSNMHKLQEEFMDDKNVLLLSHSVTPQKDSVSVLNDYAAANDVITEKWHLVTGNQKEIYDLGRKSYFVEEDLGLERNEDEFLHTENFILVDAHKHIRGIYNGINKASIEQLIADIKILQKES